MVTTLETGRDAARRHAWAEAVDALTAADQETPLSPEDLEILGASAWWAARADDSTDALERAFAGFDAAGRVEDAARVGFALGYQAFRRNAGAVGAGWAARVQALLKDYPDSPVNASLGVATAIGLLESGDLDGAITVLDASIELGRRIGNRDALYGAMSVRAMADVLSGHWQEGLAALDEAAAAAASGGLDLRVASDIFCITIGACRNIGDLDRAAQWADESERWMRRNGSGGYPGICRVHRAEIKMLRGQWTEAESEAREACDELQRFRLVDGLGYAHNAIGEIRLRKGDLDGATEAFDRAYESGHSAQPGLSLVLLARGRVDEARRSIDRALATAAGSGSFVDFTARGRLLPALVDIALAGGDLETARRSVEELETIAAEFERPLYRAGALTARGEVLLGEHRAAEASSILAESWRLWQATDLPYEAARARLHYAQALTADGDGEAARRDLLAVRGTFERLGAALDLQRVDELLAHDGDGTGGSESGGERATMTFMFTDIVTSTDLVGLIGDEAWSSLLEWHDRELRASFDAHHGEVANHTGDGFFVAFERSTDAIASAIDIQRRLVRHRRDHGFAPWVRIGLHAATATRRGRDYRGRGVHVAARVAAAAQREEILATAAALGDAPAGLRLAEPRELTLKGVAEPVEVRAIEWR